MTREDAIKILRANVMVACDTSDKVGYDTPLNKAIEQALDMAIKVSEQETVPREHYEHEFFLRKELDFKVARLEKQIAEQEPCEDCVSRKAVIKAVDSHTFDTNNGLCLDDDISCILEELPSVTPTRKKGKWIYHLERDDYNDYENEYYECPFCHDLGGDKHYHYCPVCGNKVKGVEE